MKSCLNKNHVFKIVFFNCIILTYLVLISNPAHSQTPGEFYNYQIDQKFNSILYNLNSGAHTALKPYSIQDSATSLKFDSLTNILNLQGRKNDGSLDKFYQHLIDFKHPPYSFYADFLPNFDLGYGLKNHTQKMYSLGVLLGGNIGKKFKFFVDGSTNRATMPSYLMSYIDQVGVIPGQGYNTAKNKIYSAWNYLAFAVSYNPTDNLNITIGRNKTFVGDGYRSLLLSDYASPYPFIKLTGILGNVSYMAMYSYMDDPISTSLTNTNQKKFGIFHYLDWNITKRLSLGFFDNVIGYFKYSNGINKPFDFYYINPIIFLKPINNSSDNPDKSILGLTSKYKFSNHLTLYGQFILNEFESKNFFSNNGSSRNKYGWQLGLRGTNIFNINNLNSLIETNNVKPYTYQARVSVESYSEHGEPLAHPWGANFREILGLINYSYGKLDFMGEMDFGYYGLDYNNLNYGKDVFKLYTQPAHAINSDTQTLNNYTGQGLTTFMSYVQASASYMLNPKYNLRLQVTMTYRDERNDQDINKTLFFKIGLFSSFKQLYGDITSFHKIQTAMY